MRGTLIKLLTVILLFVTVFALQAFGQCNSIIGIESGQKPDGVCAPVELIMNVSYTFMAPNDPSLVQFRFEWNDGTGARDIVPSVTSDNLTFTAEADHIYPPADMSDCSYTAVASVIVNGDTCSSSQEQTFAAWSTDNHNGGEIIIEPDVAQFCEGEEIYVQFRDNSTFNCNITMEHDKPNRRSRWVQFIYGTTSTGGDRIPNITVTDFAGNEYLLTDAVGNSMPSLYGPVVEIPANADGPSQLAWPITAPAGGIAGDIFEITMRNWNICNPYDDPVDGVPTSDPVNGDNQPITTTAFIEIITTPPVITNPSLEFCAGSPVNLTLSTSGGEVLWYADSLLETQIHSGSSFDPTGEPTNIDNTTGGTYEFWVTETIGECASAPSRVSFTIYDTPAPLPFAGNDTSVCDNTFVLKGNGPSTGIGHWETTSSANIADPLDSNSIVNNLEFGPNLFRWVMTNGPCRSEDDVVVISDLQPAPADAGLDQIFCDNNNAVLDAVSPTNSGRGNWTVASGNAIFSDSHNPDAIASSIQGGLNELVWTVTSRYGVCISSEDTMRILKDRTPDPAEAGPSRGVCDSSNIYLQALSATNGGSGSWSVVSGSGIITDSDSAKSEVTGLSYGTNQFRWTVVSQYGECSGSTDIVTITRDYAPDPADAGGDQALCSSYSAPLAANNASVGTGYWSVLSNPSATAPVFIPSVNDPQATIQISADNEGIYLLAWTIRNGSCISTDSIQVDFGLPVPPANAGYDDTICGTEITLNGNSPGIGIGTWTKISGSGDVSFLPGNHYNSTVARIESGEEGYYIFEWRITSGSCPPSADSVGIFFKPMPGVPSAIGDNKCGPGSFTLTSTPGINGDINRWYENSLGGALLSESNEYSTPILTNNTDYWVSSFDNETGCESFRRRVELLIYPVPDVPAAADVQHCGNAIVTIPSTVGNNGTTNRWYDDSTGGFMLAQNDTFTSTLLSAPANYWVSSYNSTTHCESNRIPIHVQIDPIPGLPIASDTSRCGEGSVEIVSSLGVNSTQNQWYDASSGGNLLDSVLVFETPYLTSSATYWVSSLNKLTGCKSTRLEINASIYPVPGYPQVADVSQCGADSFELGSTPGLHGTVSRWYDSIIGGNLLHIGDSYLTGYLVSTRNFYVSSYNETTHCESGRRQATAIILPVPQANTITGPSSVGINQTNVIYSVSYNPGYTYNWTIPPGIDSVLESQNLVMLRFPNIGTYHISVTETNSIGCEGPPASKEIEVKTNLIVLEINTTQGEICAETDLQLSVSPTGGTPSYTFLWGGDIGYLSAVDISNPVFSALYPGSYQLTITVNDINLNHTSDTINIVVYENPVAEIIAADTAICTGTNLSLNSIASGGSGTYTFYTWTGQTSPLSVTDIANPVFNTYSRGIYDLILTITDTHGCLGIDSVSILNDSPRSAFSSDAAPGCSPVEVNFTNESENAVSWNWDFGDGSVSPEYEPAHIFINQSASVKYYNVILTAVSSNNCIHTSNDYITVYPNPELVISTYPEKACAPADILLSSTPGGFSYNWDFGDGSSAKGDFNIMHTFLNDTEHDTSFLIQLISTSYFGCEDTASATIIVHPSPEASFNVDPLSQMIPDRTVNFTNTTETGNWKYLWRFGDDSVSSEYDPVSHIYPGPGDYLIYLIVKGQHCADSTWASIEILPHPPIAAFKPVEPGCMPLTIQFENASSYSNSFLWEFGDGAVSNKPNPEYTYYEPGSYKIKLTAWGDYGSVDSYSTENDVYVLPNAFFDIKPRRVYVNDQAVLFENQSDNGSFPVDGNTYLWDFGDGTGTEEKNPTHMYKKEGEYDVTLCVWTDKGCYDVFEYKTAVLVEPSGRIIFPNVFSPEADLEENKIFRPGVIDFVAEYHLMIFNRWGELIYESFNQEVGWDGMANGKMAKEDVYIWKVQGKYTSGQTFVQTGDVTLLH